MTRTGRPTTLAFNGMVATPHYLASAAGLEALRAGGTAIDAAIAANAVLTVVYPDQTSIGGDCFLIYYEASTGKLHGLNGSGRSPRAANRDELRAAGHATMPRRGIHTVTVPGTIDAWVVASERFGRLGLDRLLQSAIRYARDGFPVAPNLAASLALTGTVDWPSEFKATYHPAGHIPGAGDRLALPELARTLALVAKQGRSAFYEGPVAEAIVATSNRLGGWMAMDDLAAHRAEWVEPLTTDYRGLTVAEMPPNSQGLTALIELNLVEREPLGTWGTADHIHPQIEAKKLAFQVRDTQLSDPAHVDIDTAHLVSKTFARELWADYDPNRAAQGAPALTGDTVYLCAVDGDGNAASLIQSIYLGFGSGVVADGTGVLLQCRGAYFSLDDDHPNRLEPGKRPLHTLMPAMLMRDGRLVGPIGTQGGDAQAQVHLQLIANLVDHGMDPQEAIEAPRWLAGGPAGADERFVSLESRFPQQTFEGLAQRGHLVHRTDPWDHGFGQAQMILRDSATGLLRGGADPRADGAAIGC
jgi:gamma-glutamyltranspeptidase/glutathione hydrolase